MKYPKKLLIILVGLFISSNISSQAKIPNSLRQGINADQKTILIALELQKQGWSYIMPEPKSAQAAWGNSDGRTTWWIGYWINKNTNKTSLEIPRLVNGKYVGDNKGQRAWRRGGSPPPPIELEWLLSSFGGIKPD